ncbi:MAG: GNAT family N-acetyltransferase [Candidatus Paceibacterota bacterium]|jgi:RimJ/RimL family protein N-acetyltransferase
MKYIYRGTTKKEKEGTLEIRLPKMSDVNQLCKFENTLSLEKTFTALQGEKISSVEGQKYILRILKDAKDKKGLTFFMFVEGELAGLASLILRPKIYNHTANVNISLIRKYRGQGLGKTLLGHLFSQVKQFTNLRLLILQVHATNKSAIKLYSGLGFKEYGRLPGGIKHHNRYIDEVLMRKKIL